MANFKNLIFKSFFCRRGGHRDWRSAADESIFVVSNFIEGQFFIGQLRKKSESKCYWNILFRISRFSFGNATACCRRRLGGGHVKSWRRRRRQRQRWRPSGPWGGSSRFLALSSSSSSWSRSSSRSWDPPRSSARCTSLSAARSGQRVEYRPFRPTVT